MNGPKMSLERAPGESRRPGGLTVAEAVERISEAHTAAREPWRYVSIVPFDVAVREVLVDLLNDHGVEADR